MTPSVCIRNGVHLHLMAQVSSKEGVLHDGAITGLGRAYFKITFVTFITSAVYVESLLYSYLISNNNITR